MEISQLSPVAPRVQVLCVEDDQTILRLYADVLAAHGYTVTAEDDGWRALDLIKTDPHRFRILITDCHMRPLSGIDLITHARQLGFPGNIIVASGGLVPDDIKRLGTLGVDRIFLKPFALPLLLAAMAALARTGDTRYPRPPSPLRPGDTTGYSQGHPVLPRPIPSST